MYLEPDQKLILYAIGALEEPLKSKIKLQKLFFLVSNVFKDLNDIFEFEPHLFGPYSEELDNLSLELIKLGLVEKKGSSFILSEKGYYHFAELKPKKELKKVICDFKDFLNDIPDDEILTFVYVFYPDYIDESSKWDKLKKDRVKFALDLLKNDKISFSKAAKISGESFSEFEMITQKNRIRWRS
ncbi:MAG: hypothetical protein AB1604_05070 [Euryarchaeota archaeon]